MAKRPDGCLAKTGCTRCCSEIFPGVNDLSFGGWGRRSRPPLQIFDRDGANGPALIRQSKGRISWSAIVVPYINQSVTTTSANGLTNFISSPTRFARHRADDEAGQMAVAKLRSSEDTDPTGYQSPLTNVVVPYIPELDEPEYDEFLSRSETTGSC